jgi:hypothetical protein
MVTCMKRSSIEAFAVSMLLVLFCVLVIEELFFPDILGVSMIPMGVFVVALWLDTYRTSRKKDTPVFRG